MHHELSSSIILKHVFVSEAVPKKILELMNVPGLTRENVASHLQVSDNLLFYLYLVYI